MNLSPEMILWLGNGERGVSSNTIFTKLTGVDALGDWPGSHPHDPADLMRCEKLLRLFPELRLRMPEMAAVSPEWAGLVAEWNDLVALVLEEAPEWMKGRGRAPKTFNRMQQIIDGARVKA